MKSILRVLLPLVIIAAGVAVFIGLKATKPEAKKNPRKELGALVEVKAVELTTERVEVLARGSVLPSRQVMLGSEIAGRVTWMNEQLVPGGRFDKGARLLRVDGKDYALAVQQQLAAVERAKTELEVEHGRRKIAQKEWELFGGKQSDGKLALREPQLKTAEVAVKSAQSVLNRAKLAASKTTIRVPFNAIVQNRNVEIGQLVSPGMGLVTLVGTDSYWVQVAVPVEQLTWFSIPGVGGTAGAQVEVRQQIGSETIIRKGTVVRLLGDVDPAGRMARILVEIADPLGHRTGAAVNSEVAGAPALPLLIGSYVEVAIAARELPNVAVVPREALREGDAIYVFTDKGALEVRKVDVAWRRQQTVLIRAGLQAGERVVVSPVPSPVPGMKLRVRDDGSLTPPAPSEKEAPATGDQQPSADAPAAAAKPTQKTP